MPIEILLGFAIGITLGLFGGGGSILTVPALVYVLGREPRAAVTASLAIVGLNSLSGMWLRRNQGGVNWRVAASFGATGMLTSYATSQISKQFAGSTLLIAFAVLMLVVGASMLLLRPPQPSAHVSALGPGVRLTGDGVGALTGMLGVGGGFGTSLMVIAMNSLAGLLGHFGEALDFAGIAVFAAAGIAGTLAGTRLAAHVEPDRLRRYFAVLVVGLALVLLYDNLGRVL